jgi:membrane associated rhomboid family serine protease
MTDVPGANQPSPDTGPPDPLSASRRVGVQVAALLVAVHLVTGFVGWSAGYEAWASWVGERPPALRTLVGGRFAPLLADQPWRLGTSALLHVDAAHLAGNALSAVLLADLVQPVLGARRTWALFLVGGVGASAVSTLLGVVRADGASGAISAWLGLVTTLAWRSGAGDLGPLRFLLSVISFANLVFPAAVFPIDIAAHVGGFLIGMLSAFALDQVRTDPQGR